MQRAKKMRRNTKTELISSQTSCRERSRRTPGEDEQEDPVIKGLRVNVDRGLDDCWSRGSRTVPVDTALVCSTPQGARA